MLIRKNVGKPVNAVTQAINDNGYNAEKCTIYLFLIRMTSCDLKD
jgi:hypothetical protein